MSSELLMEMPPLMVAVWPKNAPKLRWSTLCSETLSLQTPVTNTNAPGPAFGRAALMLGYALGLVPLQSTVKNCACDLAGADHSRTAGIINSRALANSFRLGF